MANVLGRDYKLLKGSDAIKGLRVLNVRHTGTLVDVSDQNSSGQAEYLDEVVRGGIEVDVEGVVDDQMLRDLAFGTSRKISGVTLQLPQSETANANADTVTAANGFIMDAYSESGPYEEAGTFRCTLKSSGALTYTQGT